MRCPSSRYATRSASLAASQRFVGDEHDRRRDRLVKPTQIFDQRRAQARDRGSRTARRAGSTTDCARERGRATPVCFWPPESVEGRSLRRSLKPNRAFAASTAEIRAEFDDPGPPLPPKTSGCPEPTNEGTAIGSGTRSRRRAVSRRELRRVAYRRSGACRTWARPKPASIRSKVLLPEPEGPSTASNSPAAIVRSIPESATRAPG